MVSLSIDQHWSEKVDFASQFLISGYHFKNADTGCGKTVTVQLLSLVLNQKLYAVNCHATTETSDLIGGLRPVRGRDLLARRILHKVKYLLINWPFQELLKAIDIPPWLAIDNLADVPLLDNDEPEGEHTSEVELGVDSVSEMVALARSIFGARPSLRQEFTETEATNKRRKLEQVGSDEDSSSSETLASMTATVDEIEELGRRHAGLFEWVDGPLVEAMKLGHMILLDEMSLAEDAVLERLNSVLEPSRTLVLAEKGEDGSLDDSRNNPVVMAHDAFRIFATMNPGGDFGKRELSPALRSRFTEIWVPPVTDKSDMELVLSRTLVCNADSMAAGGTLERPMMTYVDWFNNVVCGAPSSPLADLKLTLRDILSWARFVVDARSANMDIDTWVAYCHGASLMHLDGLGLGAGMAREDVVAAKARAEEFLTRQTAEAGHVASFTAQQMEFTVKDGCFGSEPFFIPVGPLPIPTTTFSLLAPTTSLNMFRVVRAMQVSKPVLLEGSPGVGKTSLICALAAAAGHKLVRINLSEQTDMSDLIGNDLPVPESGTGGASFKWCDGVLLTAIKEGSWVLLDELNLASQSVLEGLNSCLDHRATVFIPELGKSFECPPSFKVFAAQNPLGQGGGRKGLPKSFLNRFTKVYVDMLGDSDLKVIVASRFPTLKKSLCYRLIDFNNRVHQEVVELRNFGESGSPWEFNLRDVFRCCELLSSGLSDVAKCARDLYVQRFRAKADRDRLAQIYKDIFGHSLPSLNPPSLSVTDETVQIGDVTLEIRADKGDCMKNPLSSGPSARLSLMEPMEAVARCVSLSWPCLLVGGPGCGKSSIVTSLAELCNATLVEQCLTPSSDVTELVGCFEQTDAFSLLGEIIVALQTCVDELLLGFPCNETMAQRAWKLSNALSEHFNGGSESTASLFAPGNLLISNAIELSKLLVTKANEDSRYDSLCGEAARACATKIGYISRQSRDENDHFIWRDGILVRAMTEGHWLYLENVNLCPSSVLDRLNSVMEKDGHLLLSEGGTSGEGSDESGYRIIKPHPNFRIFLSMNPSHGEISRAMRNRCVEISLLRPIGEKTAENDIAFAKLSSVVTEEAAIDTLGLLWRGGIRLSEMGVALLETYANELDQSLKSSEEPPSVRGILGSSLMLSTLLSRGISGQTCLSKLLQLLFEIEEPEASSYVLNERFEGLRSATYSPLPPFPDVRSLWCLDSKYSRVGWEARHLREFAEFTFNPSITLVQRDFLGFLGEPTNDSVIATPFASIEGSPQNHDSVALWNYLLQIFLAKTRPTTRMSMFSFLDRLDGLCSRAFGAMVSIIHKHLLEGDQQHTDEYRIRCPSVALRMSRLSQRLKELEWYNRMSTRGVADSRLTQFSVLEASYLLHDGRLDRVRVTCNATPALFPVIRALDEWSERMLESLSCLKQNETSLVDLFRDFLSQRDGLWCCLANARFLGHPSAFLGFDEAEFVVQWKWLKKSLSKLLRNSFQGANLAKDKQRLDQLIDTVDAVLFGGSGGRCSVNAVRKKMGLPLVPHQAFHWDAIGKLRGLARSYTVLTEERFCSFASSFDALELSELVDNQHPVLYIQLEDKFNLLAAISMAHWTAIAEQERQKGADPPHFSSFDAVNSLQWSLESKQKTFVNNMMSVKVDVKIETVENLISVEGMEKLRVSDSATTDTSLYSQFIDKLLDSFGRIQISALADYWSSHEELRIMSEMYRILIMSRSSTFPLGIVKGLQPALKQFISVVISKTTRSVADLQPYQTLLWALESNLEGVSLERLLRSLLPTMSVTASTHMWSNSFVDLNAISERLEFPTLWGNDDRHSKHGAINSRNNISQQYGPVRLRQRVRSEVAFRIMGSQFGVIGRRYTKCFTIENHRAKRVQTRELLDMFSSLSLRTGDSAPFEILYLLSDVLQALLPFFPEESGQRLVGLVLRPERLQGVTQDELTQLGKSCSHDVFLNSLSSLVLPLFGAIRQIWKGGCIDSCNEQIALAWIYLGLLRVNFVVPDSPLDPGRAPLAKVSLINRKLSDIQVKTTALRIDSGFNVGKFSPQSEEIYQLIDDGKKLATKRASQEKKIIQRPEAGPPFYDLFREVSDFMNGIAATGFVLELVELVKNSRNQAEHISFVRKREQNWERTVTAFCGRLRSSFAIYEDITTPIVESLLWVQRGMCILVDRCIPSDNYCPIGAFDALLRFPTGHLNEGIRAIALAVGDLENDQHFSGNDQSSCSVPLSFATLARLVAQKRLIGLDNQSVSTCVAILKTLVKAQLGVTATQSESRELEAERQEREFREQFPDHHTEFSRLLQASEDEEDEDGKPPLEDSDFISDIRSSMTVEDTALLCSLHRELFSDDVVQMNDAARRRCFAISYGAACCLEMPLLLELPFLTNCDTNSIAVKLRSKSITVVAVMIKIKVTTSPSDPSTQRIEQLMFHLVREMYLNDRPTVSGTYPLWNSTRPVRSKS